MSHKSCYADAGSDDDNLTIKTVNTVNLGHRKPKELHNQSIFKNKAKQY